MGWPNKTDYSEAVQNPELCFTEETGLRGGHVKPNRRGLPMLSAGAFGVAFRVSIGAERWAVKCFTREVRELRERYESVSSYLETIGWPDFVVRFKYFERGIRVAAKWYPVLKMEWVDGQSIDSFLEEHRCQPEILESLAAEWTSIIDALRAKSIAHGDLQHGNILVGAGEKVTLIDLDGMFVPPLSGRTSNERGHSNYQHPGRGDNDFGMHIDQFPALVVLASIRAVADNPDLWQQLNAGDDCLLFRQRDFLDPDASRALRLVLDSRSNKVRDLALEIKRSLKMPLEQTPLLPGKESGAPRWVKLNKVIEELCLPELAPDFEIPMHLGLDGPIWADYRTTEGAPEAGVAEDPEVGFADERISLTASVGVVTVSSLFFMMDKIGIWQCSVLTALFAIPTAVLLIARFFTLSSQEHGRLLSLVNDANESINEIQSEIQSSGNAIAALAEEPLPPERNMSNFPSYCSIGLQRPPTRSTA